VTGSEAEVGSVFFAGRVLLMLGKVQFELQKLVDCYVSCCFVIKITKSPGFVVVLIFSLIFSAFSHKSDNHKPVRVSSE
jgi:hypothetical protein